VQDGRFDDEETEMAEVTVKLYSVLREVAGKSTLKMAVPDKSSVKDVLEKIIHQFKEGFEDRYRLVGGDNIAEYFLVFVNSTPISHLEGLETKIEEGDVLDILEPVSGG